MGFFYAWLRRAAIFIPLVVPFVGTDPMTRRFVSVGTSRVAFVLRLCQFKESSIIQEIEFISEV
jgi:hypothetical protein